MTPYLRRNDNSELYGQVVFISFLYMLIWASGIEYYDFGRNKKGNNTPSPPNSTKTIENQYWTGGEGVLINFSLEMSRIEDWAQFH